MAPERDYAELSQLVRAATESSGQHAPAHHRPPTAPAPAAAAAAAAAAAGNGLVLGNSALNARYMGQQQQQVNHPAVAAVLTLTLLHSKMFDVGDLPVLSFGNCLLKTGMIKWPLKLYVRFLRFKRFFHKIPKHDLLCFSSCCARFLECWVPSECCSSNFARLPPHRWTTLYHGCARSSASGRSRMQVLPPGTLCPTTSAPWLILSSSENC